MIRISSISCHSVVIVVVDIVGAAAAVGDDGGSGGGGCGDSDGGDAGSGDDRGVAAAAHAVAAVAITLCVDLLCHCFLQKHVSTSFYSTDYWWRLQRAANISLIRGSLILP